MNRTILFADIDGTLVRRSLEQWLLLYLRKNRLLKFSILLKNSLSHLANWPLPRWYEWKLVYLQNRYETEVSGWIEACWKLYIQPALHTESIQLIDAFRQQGVRVVLVTGTPRPLAEPLMKYLDINDSICAEPVIRQHRYTGALQKPHPRGFSKVQYINEWLSENRTSWNRTIAMADHWHDRHLLFKVAYPIITHPKPKLKRLAIQKHWLIFTHQNQLKSVIQNYQHLL